MSSSRFQPQPRTSGIKQKIHTHWKGWGMLRVKQYRWEKGVKISFLCLFPLYIMLYPLKSRFLRDVSSVRSYTTAQSSSPDLMVILLVSCKMWTDCVKCCMEIWELEGCWTGFRSWRSSSAARWSTLLGSHPSAASSWPTCHAALHQ